MEETELNYETGRDVRRKGKPATECANAEQLNGYWYQDGVMGQVSANDNYSTLIKPRAKDRVGTWA